MNECFGFSKHKGFETFRSPEIKKQNQFAGRDKAKEKANGNQKQEPTKEKNKTQAQGVCI